MQNDVCVDDEEVRGRQDLATDGGERSGERVKNRLLGVGDVLWEAEGASDHAARNIIAEVVLTDDPVHGSTPGHLYVSFLTKHSVLCLRPTKDPGLVRAWGHPSTRHFYTRLRTFTS